MSMGNGWIKLGLLISMMVAIPRGAVAALPASGAASSLRLGMSASLAMRLASTDAETMARTLSIQGFLKAERGDHQGAIADYDRALQLNPADLDVYYNRGVSRAALKDFQGAISDYNAVLRMDPHSGDALFNRGMAYAATSNRRAALKDLTNAINIYELRVTLNQLVNPAATDDPSTLAPTNPITNLPYLYYHRGGVWLDLEQPAMSMADWQRAATLAQQIGDRTLATIIQNEINRLLALPQR